MPNRIIKESICTSETLAECSVGANLLFDRLTTKADDHGCFDARVKIIRCGVFPLMMGKVKESDIEKWLNELQSTDCIRMWTHTNGVKYGLFPNFSGHQTVRSIHKRKTPEPPKSLTLLKTDTSSVDSSCKQVQADECLNHNPNPNLNLKTPIGQKTPSAPGRDSWFEAIWGKYPRKLKKHEAGLKFKKQVLTEQDWLDIQQALKNYIHDTERIRANGHPDREWQHGSTWFNHVWRDYVGLSPPEERREESWAESYERRKLEEKQGGTA